MVLGARSCRILNRNIWCTVGSSQRAFWGWSTSNTKFELIIADARVQGLAVGGRKKNMYGLTIEAWRKGGGPTILATLNSSWTLQVSLSKYELLRSTRLDRWVIGYSLPETRKPSQLTKLNTDLREGRISDFSVWLIVVVMLPNLQ